MRAWTTIAAMSVLGVSLAGCDMPGSHQQQAAVAPIPPCNCRQASETMTAPAEPTEHLRRFAYAPRHYYHRYRYYAQARPVHYRGHYSTYSEQYDVARSQQSVDAYDYVSSSRVTRSDYSETEYGRRGYAASSYAQSGYAGGYEGGYSGGRIVWVDGYGRGYFSSGPVTVAATMRGKRLTTWHGYGVDCPDDGEPNGMIAP